MKTPTYILFAVFLSLIILFLVTQGVSLQILKSMRHDTTPSSGILPDTEVYFK